MELRWDVKMVVMLALMLDKSLAVNWALQSVDCLVHWKADQTEILMEQLLAANLAD